MRYTLMIWFALSIGANVVAQDKKEYDWKTNLQVADDLFNRGSYYNAADFYKKVVALKPNDAALLWKLAESQRLIRDYSSAAQNYKLIVAKTDKYPLAHFYYGQMLKMSGDCSESGKQFDAFVTKSAGKFPDLEKLSKVEKQGCEQINSFPDASDVRLIHLDTKVNSYGTDFAPFPLSATELVFSTIRTDTPIVIKDTMSFFNKAALARLYMVKQQGETWSDATLLPESINKNDLSAANGAFTPDRSVFFFSECSYDRTLKVHCDIYASRYRNGQFDQPMKLPSQINGAGYTSTQPTVESVGPNQNYLYFSSDRPGGVGGRDIWVSKFDDNLGFQAPTNVKEINTVGDEVTPFFDETKSSLYFSSNGWPGFGGFDIFATVKGKDGLSVPANIGRPFNSASDDLYYSLYTDFKTGYLASNRPGTMSLRSESTSEDIYSFKLKKIVEYNAYAVQLGDDTKTPIPGAKLTLFKKNEKSDKYEQQPDSLVTVVGDHFDLKLKEGFDYKLVATKDKYLSDSKFITKKQLDDANGLQDIYFTLDKINKDKSYKLNNIYYDYKSSTLRDSSKIVLDTLVMLLEANPKIVIELSSHTDSRGGAEYNKQLSQERAESCVNYLISRGINTKRLIPKGYGKEQLLNKCSDGVECTEEEHQKNRRTVFKVVGELEEGQMIK